MAHDCVKHRCVCISSLLIAFKSLNFHVSLSQPENTLNVSFITQLWKTTCDIIGVSQFRSQPLFWLKPCLTWSAHCGGKSDTPRSSADVDFRQFDFGASSPAPKCQESWCSVGDGGSPATTSCSQARLSFLSVYCGKCCFVFFANWPTWCTETWLKSSENYLLSFLIAGGSGH